MPRYTFECPECNTRFSKKLKMGEHSNYPCISCGAEAIRQWEGFGFDFQEGATPGNSGVTKHDYPTADQAVGRDAEKRWAVIAARDKVKDRVRVMGGHRALTRRDGVENGESYVEYKSGGEELVKMRRKLVRQVDEVYKKARDTST